MKNTTPKQYWNIRVVFDVKTNQIGFKEIHYKNDKITGWTTDFISPNKILKSHLKEALKKPILKQNKKLKEIKK